MSPSAVAFRSLTLPASMPLIGSAASTLRSVTGSSAIPSFSAKRSTMPKGDAANFANGGMAPVATFSGKLLALLKARPDASLKSFGSVSENWVCSGIKA